MKKSGKTSWRKVFTLVTAIFVLFLSVWAQAADAGALAKEINSELRSAQKDMFSGKKDQALAKLETISSKITELKSLDPRHRQLKSLESKFLRLKKDIERRTGKKISPKQDEGRKKEDRRAPTVAPADAPAKDKTTEVGNELPSAVSYRLKKIKAALGGKRMREDPFHLMAEIEKKYAGKYPADHPEIVAVKKQLAELKASRENKAKAEAVAAEKGKADELAREKASKVWIEKLKIYTESYDAKNSRPNPKYVTAVCSQDVNELDRISKNFEEASALFAEYSKVDFPNGKTRELQSIEDTLSKNLKAFTETQKQNLSRVADRPMKRIEELMSALKRDTAWKTDSSKKPHCLRKDDLPAVKELIDKAAKVLGKDSPAITAVRKNYDDLVKMDLERRKIAAERTFMIADKFKGSGISDLKAKARKIVEDKFGDAKVLRVTIISNDWKEENVKEWTDTTKTAVRHRITRSVSGQVAARKSDGVFLYTVHIAKDKQGGGWGPLKGHVMFTDLIVEGNVNKSAP